MATSTGPNEGSSFSFWVPLREDIFSEEEVQIEEEVRGVSPGRSLSVLLVDDNAVNQLVIK
jgi:hypothetical protein